MLVKANPIILSGSEYEAVRARLLARCRVVGECLEWTGTTNASGRGRIDINGKMTTVGRAAYTVFVGPIPGDLRVLHRCDNPRCINPLHLFLGTMSCNTLDMYGKCRQGKHLVGGGTHFRSKLSDSDAAFIRRLRGSSLTKRELADLYGVCQSTIGNIQSGRTYKDAKEDK